MVKKKYFLLLSTLLLTVLLGLSGTCYAKELTSTELKNFIYNYCIFYGFNEEQSKTIVTDFENLPNANDNSDLEINRWLNITNNLYEGYYILSAYNGYILLTRYGGTESNLQRYVPYFYRPYDTDCIYFPTSYLNVWSTIYNVNQPTTQTTTFSQGSANPISLALNNAYWFFYVDCNVYRNYDLNTNPALVWSAGFSKPTDIFSGIYQDDYFSFLLNSSLDTIIIEGDSVPVYDFQTNQAQSFTLGQLGLADNFDYAELFEYRWHWDRWKLNKITKLNNIGPVTDNLIAVTINGSMTNSNTLYSLQMNSDPDSDFTNISQPFFIKNRNTAIVNGALDIGATFSGDYGLIYNDNTNTQSILDTLTDEQKENAALNDFDTVLSGDASDVASNLGFVDLSDTSLGFGFPVNIYDRLVVAFNNLTDVLLESEPQTFTFYLHGNTGQIVLNTNDFITPEGPLKVFMRLFLVTCTIFVIWNQFYRYYELLSTFNVVLLMHDLDVEKTVFRM